MDQLVATRTAARKCFCLPTCALALALTFLPLTRQLRRWGPFANTLPITAALATTALLAALTRTPTTTRAPTTPTTGQLTTTSAAITRLGSRRLKPAFATLQKTTPRTRTTTPLIPPRLTVILVLAHGSLYSRRSSFGVKRLLHSEASLPALLHQLLHAGRTTTHFNLPRPSQTEPAIRGHPSPSAPYTAFRATPPSHHNAPAHVTPPNWPPSSPPLTSESPKQPSRISQ